MNNIKLKNNYHKDILTSNKTFKESYICESSKFNEYLLRTDVRTKLSSLGYCYEEYLNVGIDALQNDLLIDGIFFTIQFSDGNYHVFASDKYQDINTQLPIAPLTIGGIYA